MCSKWCYLYYYLMVVLPLLAGSMESCLGGRSLRGLSNIDWPSTTTTTTTVGRLQSLSCCDDECHGGLTLKNTSFIISPVGDLKLGARRYAQALESSNDRHKRSIVDDGNKMASAELRCCSANMSVFFPVSALSALTGKRVHVIQAPPLIIQPVIFGRCEKESSSILDAECRQDYTPEMMHVARINPEFNDELELTREPVMVESGCSCRLNPEPLEIIDGPDIDETMISFLNLLVSN